jgi:predicted nucleic acid-binding protein
MMFWDSSAIVPLIVEERTSQRCRQLLRADQRMIVWALSRTEVCSALCRQQREQRLTTEELDRALGRLDTLAAFWTEIDALAAVRERAERLLLGHPLRAADALQLAAALIACRDRPKHLALVASDETLVRSAAREGFTVIVPPV